MSVSLAPTAFSSSASRTAVSSGRRGVVACRAVAQHRSQTETIKHIAVVAGAAAALLVSFTVDTACPPVLMPATKSERHLSGQGGAMQHVNCSPSQIGGSVKVLCILGMRMPKTRQCTNADMMLVQAPSAAQAYPRYSMQSSQPLMEVADAPNVSPKPSVSLLCTACSYVAVLQQILTSVLCVL